MAGLWGRAVLGYSTQESNWRLTPRTCSPPSEEGPEESLLGSAIGLTGATLEPDFPLAGAPVPGMGGLGAGGKRRGCTYAKSGHSTFLLILRWVSSVSLSHRRTGRSAVSQEHTWVRETQEVTQKTVGETGDQQCPWRDPGAVG
jgi:hypothetical protein